MMMSDEYVRKKKKITPSSSYSSSSQDLVAEDQTPVNGGRGEGGNHKKSNQ